MPCRDFDSDDLIRMDLQRVQGEAKEALAIVKTLKERLDQHAVLLCEATDIIKKNGALNAANCSSDLLAWRQQHELHDLAELRRNALAKLTPEEIKALGL